MRLIDADALIEEALTEGAYGYVDAKQIADAPTIDAVPVRHGHWIYHPDDLFPNDSTQECSYCHEEESLTLYNDNYCPNCGTKMDEVSE